MRKQKIPRALREQVWITYAGKKFESKCFVGWCGNMISVFNFEVGHNIPESKGGTLNIETYLCEMQSFNGKYVFY
jgi:hypothetical protein